MSFLKKGWRKSQLKKIKEIEQDIKIFNTMFIALNDAYNKLLNVEHLDHNNFQEELEKVSSFKFNEKQIKLLKRDLLNDYTETS